MPMSEAEVGDTERWRRINALLAAALALPDDARTAWLGQLGPADASLAPLLRTLLARATVETDAFMHRPVSGVLAQALAAEPGPERAGDTVGPYRLIRELGRGGMGTVWLADRVDGTLQRQVALKLPLSGWAPGVAQRLQQERDRLAVLEHPNIARLYDAGTTAGGRPYLAMEYVDGVPLDVHAGQRALTVEARVRLFLQVTRAVAYAHARLIVHRDLKPSNILVTPAGDVRLLDFGAAKLLDDPAARDSALTRQAGRMLSPDYASPEQILGEPITVASDVYSAGVVLYELLAGCRPYRLKRGTVAALEEAILAADVPLASTRLPQDPRRARLLRGDLDTILAKALQRGAAQRYSSIEAFADDLGRYLAREPVLAQPDRLGYRLGKFLRRRAVPVAAGSLAVLALAVGGGVALWQEQVARAEAARAERVKQFVASIFTQAVPRNGVGGVVTASDLLEAAAGRIEHELADDPAIAAELGILIADSFDVLGEPAKSEAPLRRAVARAEQAFGPHHRVTLHARLVLAVVVGTHDLQESSALLDAVLPDLLAGVPATTSDALDALKQRAFVLAKQSRAEESYLTLRQAIDLSGRQFGPQHENTIWLLGSLANTYGRFGERRLELEAASEAWRRATRAVGTQRPNLTLISVERWYSEALRRNDRLAEALPIARRVLAEQRQLDAATTVRVRNAMLPLALTLAANGRIVEALPLMREAVALEQQQNPLESDDRLAFAGANAVILAQAGHIDAAWRESERAEAIAARLAQRDTHAEQVRALRRARLLIWRGELDAAAQAAESIIRAAGVDPGLAAHAELVRATVERLQVRPAAARDRLRRLLAAASFPALLPSAQAAAYAELGLATLDLGAFEQARAPLQRCREIYAGLRVAVSVNMESCIIGQARARLHEGSAAEAQALLLPLGREWQELGADARRSAPLRRWLEHARQGATAPPTARSVSPSRPGSVASSGP